MDVGEGGDQQGRAALPALWVAAVVGLAMVLPVLGGASVQDVLSLSRAGWAQGEAWRLWTAHFVHFGGRHAGLDGVALTALSWAVAQRAGWRFVAAAVLVGAPLLSLAVLLLEPGLREYRGASGLVVALAVGCWAEVGAGLRGSGPVRSIAWVLLGAVFGLKLILDVAVGASPVLPAGVQVAWSAHLAGALLGIAGWAVFRRGQDLRR